MSCRHGPNDPECTNTPQYNRGLRAGYERGKAEAPPTPDAENYEIVQVEFVGEHLVVKVKYPNCAKCAFEGDKVMVFFNVTPKQALMWRRIDPHFRDPSAIGKAREAPSPAARFPATPDGWADACNYARGKCRSQAR